MRKGDAEGNRKAKVRGWGNRNTGVVKANAARGPASGDQTGGGEKATIRDSHAKTGPVKSREKPKQTGGTEGP